MGYYSRAVILSRVYDGRLKITCEGRGAWQVRTLAGAAVGPAMPTAEKADAEAWRLVSDAPAAFAVDND